MVVTNATSSVVPTTEGGDLENVDHIIDGHIRIETYSHLGTNIYVDLFDSRVADAYQAQMVSKVFPSTLSGARESTKFLRDYGFAARVVLE